MELFDWLLIVWQHLNEILEDFCDADSTIGIKTCVCVWNLFILTILFYGQLAK